ncbi:MAG: FtsW/RodA/SpoVE family cell cycle protein [Myxococcota bacterium]
MPTKGLTLPLVSYGRTSMIVAAIAAGILFRASAEERAHAEFRPRPKLRRRPKR